MNLIEVNDATLIEAAREYASRGWPVLPLKPRLKTPATKHGLLDASSEIVVVDKWWSKWPDANIGLRTGVAFDVLDVDGPAGRASLARIAPGYQHRGPVASTGKGWHALFNVTGARNAANKEPGLDFRGVNGYIVASPSRHPNGHQYQWARDGKLTNAPDWLFQVLTPQREPRGEGWEVSAIMDVWNNSFGAMIETMQVGENYRANCPWHEDSTPSFYLYPHNNSFFCFGCGQWGDTLDLGESWKQGGEPPSKWQAQP